jgi:hypothetical protein
MVRSLSSPYDICGGQSGFFPSAFVSPVSIIPPVLYTDLPVNTTPLRWTSGRSLRTLKHSSSYIWEHLKERTFVSCLPVFKGLNYFRTCFFGLRHLG